MCGRTCLTLSPDEICEACSKTDQKLEWRSEPNLGRRYEGHIDNKGYNTTPQDITPVLVSGDHFLDENEKSEEFQPVVVPMLWGIIPRYHKGDYRKHGLTTNNCRLEGLLESRIYKPLLKAGQRCVVLCEGFYEWQTVTNVKSSERKVFYIFFPQEKGVKMEDKSTWNDVKRLKLFMCAGLFDVWYDENGDTMYNYTVITFESDKTLAWLHHRTPAVLETQQQVDDWLDFRRVSDTEALKLLTQPRNLEWYQVSKTVNNSRNKSAECNKPLSEEKVPKSKMMQQWLTKNTKNEVKNEQISFKEELVSPKKEKISPKKEGNSSKNEEISVKKEKISPKGNKKRSSDEGNSSKDTKRTKIE
ncbi:abasic site processing protein HMCES [Culicoides brevitarsis]|uniref:abasic site processing protein HMCES n=1 Tax=Culicoides brevitarsis TaxID=469753 RepID=UPI00307C6E7B